MSDFILISYKFDDKSKAFLKLDESKISKEIKSKSLAWVHLDATKKESKEWLEKEISYLDPFIIEALIDEETRPRVTEIGDGVLVILRGVNLNKNADPEDMVSIRLWVDSHRIISLQRRQLKALLDIEESIKSKKNIKNSGDFLCALIAKLFEKMEPALLNLDENTDDIEEQILDKPDINLREKIVEVRKQAIIFRRYMAPQKDAIAKLYLSEVEWLNGTHRRHLQESYNRVMRYVEDLDAVRERAQIVKDELANVLSDRLNKNMYILSVIAAIFLPLGFFTGLLGINVGGIPGSENSNAFFIFCGGLSVLVAMQIFVFKKLRWF
jgi:zinc transporter